jgi:hypothetical protein
MATAEERTAAATAPVATEAQRASGPVIPEPPTGGELVSLRRETAADRLAREPVISGIDAKTFGLIRQTIGVNCTDAEIGWFLELCAHYDLAWEAREAWLAKGKSQDGGDGRLLIMVGRDGIRKIVQRNGIAMEADVKRANDFYTVFFLQTPWDAEQIGMSAETWRQQGGGFPFHHVVHRWEGMGAERGAIVGSWARCYDRRTRRETGWFEAPLEEYRPANPSAKSVWSKQVTVMALAAAERQAGRQSTPLGGLLVEGEDESIEASATAVPVELPPAVAAIVERARSLGRADLSNPGTVAMMVDGQPPSAVETWVAGRTAELDDLAQRSREEVAELAAAARPAADDAAPVTAWPEVERIGDPDALEEAILETQRRLDAEQAEPDLDGEVITALAERLEGLRAQRTSPEDD